MKEFIYKLTLVDIGRMGCDKSRCKVNYGKCVELAFILLTVYIHTHISI
jgi:hypothetical protein